MFYVTVLNIADFLLLVDIGLSQQFIHRGDDTFPFFYGITMPLLKAEHWPNSAAQAENSEVISRYFSMFILPCSSEQVIKNACLEYCRHDNRIFLSITYNQAGRRGQAFL
jgi:hypothetical protein